MNGRQIQKITAEGLIYLADNGREAFVDFPLCYERHFQSTTSPDYVERMKELNPQMRWDDEGIKEYIERRTNWKVIADRDITGNPPYIEFYTEPPLRFEFPTVEDLQTVRRTIERLGWRTFDLS